MPDLPPSDRYKADMPQIPGVSPPSLKRAQGSNPAIRFIAALIVVLVLLFIGVRWAHHTKHLESRPAEPVAQIEVPSPPLDPAAALPHATESEPGIATTTDMVKTWSSRDFFIKNRLTGENIPATIIRLPGGSGAQASSFWAFSLKSPYGNCQMEYVTDLGKLKAEYDYKSARHPMVGNPCSHTLFDPLRMTNLPGNVWVRGAIVQGSDLRPPFGIEIKIQGKKILATRTE
ncbi:MAG: hypothetical protein NVS9B13_01230 [Candidatus Acidiferrum sp.]